MQADTLEMLSDELFDFDTALDRAVTFLDDETAMNVLRVSFERIVVSGDLDRLMQATMTLAATACNHAHLQAFSTELSAQFSVDDEFGHGHPDEHTEDHKDEGHEHGCLSKKGGDCNCK